MNPSFQILPSSIDAANAILYIEISSQGLNYVILSNQVAIGLAFYNFNSIPSEQQAADHIHQIIAEQSFLQQKYAAVHIIYSYTASVLVPQDFFGDTEHKAMLELVHGNCGDCIIRTDYIKEHSIHNVFSVPQVIDQVMTGYFNTASHKHYFSLLSILESGLANHLYCIFSPGHVKVVFKKAGKLQAVQLFVFKTPEDAAYYLLNLCQSFEVKAADCELKLSGMIDESSALYKELYKYFLHIQFERLSETFTYPEEMDQYPNHYFSHLFSIAACV